ncbi:hypothetical protein A7U60_g695 [Sanghuangporus baumii]|uniref:Uncharacterized protein n=1 Tax=Sanghuangporus baumii TaxID=108892 RepID=A0A9Q5I6A1_SANBA|nr:hypothetical protein A7U60_g695 [Sanghuangporus baumii]
MLASTLFVFLSFFDALVVAQNASSVVCIAGQCVQGFTNLTLGTTLSASGSTTNLHLLPGQYTESTNPQLLHSLLTSSSATIASSAGFPNSSSVSLPLSIQLQPGFAFYSSANYSGAANYVPLPTSANASNVTTPFNGGSFVLSSDTWAELSSSNGRFILWDASPDVSQLPGSFAGLSLSQLQSSSCSSACASGGSVNWAAQPAPTPLELARPTGLTTGNGFVADNNKKECEACAEKCTACGIDGFSIASTIDQVKCTACLPGSVLSDGQCVESCPTPAQALQTSASHVQITFSHRRDLAYPPAHLALSLPPAPAYCATQIARLALVARSINAPPVRPRDPSCRTDVVCRRAPKTNSPTLLPEMGNVTAVTVLVRAVLGLEVQTVSAVPMAAITNVVSGLGACLSDLVAIPQVSGSGTASVPLPTITGIDTPTQPSSGGSSLEWWEIFLMALGCAFILLCIALCWRRRARKKRAQQTREFARAKKLDDGLTWKERVVRFGEKLFGHTLGERVLGTRKPGTGPIALQDVGPVDDKRSEFFRMRERDLEEARYERDIDKLLDGYAYPRSQTLNTYDERSRYLARVHTAAPVRSHSSRSKYSKSYRKERARDLDRDVDLNTMSDESIYTYLTGQPRHAADVRQPVRSGATPIPTTTLDLDVRDLERDRRPYLLERDRARGRGLESRFSVSSYSDSSYRSRSLLDRQRSPGSRSNGSSSRAPTPAQEYALSVADREFKRGRSPLGREHRSPSHRLIDLDDPAEEYGRGAGTGGRRGEYWLRPTYTNSSGGSRNPFRR